MSLGSGRPAGDDAEKAHGVDTTNQAPGPELGGQPAEPSVDMPGRHPLVLLVLSALASMIISGGVNFGIACAIYRVKDRTPDGSQEKTAVSPPARYIIMSTKLAGDAAMTVAVHCLLTWLVEAWHVPRYLSRGLVRPFRQVGRGPPRPLRRLFFLPRDPGTAPTARVPVFSPRALVGHFFRGLLLMVVAFMVPFSNSISVLMFVAPRSERWLPHIFKMLLGVWLGLIVTPLADLFWLVRGGWVARHGASANAPGQSDRDPVWPPPEAAI